MARRRRNPVKVEIGGGSAKHIRRNNEQFEKHYREVMLRHALRPAANYVERLMKALAPKLTGFMADNIEQKEKRGKVTDSITVRPNYRLYPDYFYAPVQEYGSEARNIQATRFVSRARRALRQIWPSLVTRATNVAIRTFRPVKEHKSGRAA